MHRMFQRGSLGQGLQNHGTQYPVSGVAMNCNMLKKPRLESVQHVSYISSLEQHQ